MATCNPFKVGDKVRLKKSSYDFNPILRGKYEGYEYSVVTRVFDIHISTTEDSRPQYDTHFELYKEEKDMTQQAQQKTKRVPFTHELWEKYKDKDVVVTTSNGKVLEQFTCFNLRDVHVYAGVYNTKATPLVGNYYSNHLFLEIPVTTKRIPFNPELKDAKVFTKSHNRLVKEWHMFSTGVVATLCETDIVVTKHDCGELEMEVEEDAP